MNKNVILGIIALLIILGVGFVVVKNTSQQNSTIQDQPINVDSTLPDEAGENTETTLKHLQKLAKNQVCTYTYTDEKMGTMRGTTYISKDGRMYSEYAFEGGDTQDMQDSKGNIISDGAYVYSWSPDTKQGMKVPITDDVKEQAEEAKREEKMQSKEALDELRKMKFSCKNWRVEESKFVPPSDITFTDYTNLMNSAQDMMEKMNIEKPPVKKDSVESDEEAVDTTEGCAVCENLQGEQKTSCKQMLGC